jgi:hypothetical protein
MSCELQAAYLILASFRIGPIRSRVEASAMTDGEHQWHFPAHARRLSWPRRPAFPAICRRSLSLCVQWVVHLCRNLCGGGPFREKGDGAMASRCGAPLPRDQNLPDGGELYRLIHMFVLVRI